MVVYKGTYPKMFINTESYKKSKVLLHGDILGDYTSKENDKGQVTKNKKQDNKGISLAWILKSTRKAVMIYYSPLMEVLKYILLFMMYTNLYGLSSAKGTCILQENSALGQINPLRSPSFFIIRAGLHGIPPEIPWPVFET